MLTSQGRLSLCRTPDSAFSRTALLGPVELDAKQQAAEDAALQTAIMLSLHEAGHLAAAPAFDRAAAAAVPRTTARSVGRKLTSE